MTIRVLEVIPTLVRGGAEKQLTLLATGLPRSEFDVHVAVLTHSGPYEAELRRQQIDVTLVGKRWKLDPLAYFRLKQLIKRLQPDVVHTWIFAANCYGRKAAFALSVPRVVAGERCVDRWKAGYELAIDRYLARRTNRIVANSSGVRDFYVEHGIDPGKFTVIPNGIEPDVPATTIHRTDWLEHLDLPDDARLIGAVGRLWPQKRYKDLIWAAELLRAGRGDTYLLIVGDGPQRMQLERYCRQIQVQSHVRFLGERDDVDQLLPHLDVFWLGSAYEGQSNALMEAMRAARPAVVTDIPGNRDLVVPDVTGYLVPVGDSATMARRTHQLLNDPDLAQRMGQAARERILKEFTLENMIARYGKLYRELVEG